MQENMEASMRARKDGAGLWREAHWQFENGIESKAEFDTVQLRQEEGNSNGTGNHAEEEEEFIINDQEVCEELSKEKKRVGILEGNRGDTRESKKKSSPASAENNIYYRRRGEDTILQARYFISNGTTKYLSVGLDGEGTTSHNLQQVIRSRAIARGM